MNQVFLLHGSTSTRPHTSLRTGEAMQQWGVLFSIILFVFLKDAVRGHRFKDDEELRPSGKELQHIASDGKAEKVC